MILYLNGYEINTITNRVWLDVEIDGLELPPIRTTSGNNAGRNGGYVGPQFFGIRVIQLQGSIFTSNVSLHMATRKALESALQGSSVTLRILADDGNSYIVYCNITTFTMPLTKSQVSSPFNIVLIAGDPIIYDNATGTALTASLPRIVAGGYTYPVVYPVVYAAGSGPTTITNSGSVAVLPVITLTGVMTNPMVTNVTTGAFIALTGLTTAPGDVVTIDMRARTVLLNGGSIFALASGMRNPISLIVGGNSLALTSVGGGDTVTGVVSWRSGSMGI